jgi:Tol biopolymer transport system component
VRVSPGSRLGPYEVVAAIGSGGMGEVYRARDPRLGRDVAIKILPGAVVADADRLRRFEQEARAAAALNHPNILSVYDIGSHDGQPYVVSELLEGQTIREGLERGAVTIKKASDWAVQVCQGLAAAHEKGIVHRDLKPENLFVTRDGRVKILDFGLAKLVEGTTGRVSDSGALYPTRTGTIPGVVMGTVGYMSPEQVRGEPADHRSDIFSFGVVLYEVLTGKGAFPGSSAIEIMSSILKEDPPELSDGIPAALARVVHRCLEKSPDSRFQSARDLGFALQVLSGSTPHLTPLKATKRRAVWPVVAGVGVLGAGVGLWAGSTLFTHAPPVFTRLTFQRGFVSGARFAPDGHTVAYSATWAGNASDVYSMSVESPDARAHGLEGAHVFAVSASGEMAIGLNAFLGAVPGMGPRGTLARVPLSGGAPRVLLSDVEDADWEPKAESLAVAHVVNGVSRLEYPVGRVLYESSGWMDSLRFSPRGDVIAFADHPLRGDDRGSVAIVDLAGKKTILSSGWETLDGVVWAPGAKELWFCGSARGSSDTVWAVTLSGKLRALMRSPTGCFLRDISADGRVLMDSFTSRNEMVWRREGESKERSLTWLTDSFPNDLSADGRTLLFTEPGLSPYYHACLRKTDGSPVVRLGEGEAESLSSDGMWVLTTLLTSPSQLLLIPTGAGEVVRLPQVGLDYQRFSQWFSGSQRILFAASEAGHGTRLWIQNVFPPDKPRPITGEGVSLRGNSISPDGHTVAAISPDGKLGLYPVEGGPVRPVPGVEAGEQLIRWSADGKQLFVYAPNGMPSVLHTIDLASGRREKLRDFMPSDPAGATFMYLILLTPDGKSGVYSFQRTESHLKMMEGLR